LAVGHIRGGLSRSLRHGFRGQGFDRLLSGFLSWRKAIFAPRPAASRSGLFQPATRRGNRQMGIAALARQESRAKAVDMTVWVGQSLAQRQPVGPCPKLAIPLGFAEPNFWPAPPTAGQRGRHAKFCRLRAVGGRPGTGLAFGRPNRHAGTRQPSLYRGLPRAYHSSGHLGAFAFLHTPRALPRSHDPTCGRHLFACPKRLTRDRPRRENCALIYERINSLAFAANHAKIT
jgi:hypothetical protein